ncbi:MAG: imidazolonepropionase [Acidobacteriota bacterium]
MQDLWIHRCRLATFAGDRPYGLLEDAALNIRDGRIAWVGPRAEAPKDLSGAATFDARNAFDAKGALVTPGLIDCHTHAVWGGDRVDEFEMRLSGVPYAEIARRGGGILSTVRSTRGADAETLARSARRRLRGLAAEGVTTVEIKSGYGLDVETELRMLRVARRLGDGGKEGASLGLTVKTSFLGAHAVPPEHAGDADGYLGEILHGMLPRVAEEGLADAVDGFCEGIAFSPGQIDRLFAAARGYGLPVKLHAEQLSLLGGAALAASHGALSADHLEYLDEEGVRAMAASGTVAVLLPGAYYFLRETRRPPVELLRRHGVPMAVATDLNPGSSPLHSLLATVNLACLLFHLTPEEALSGVTREAAKALGMADEVGTLEVGKRADLALFDVDRPATLVANLGANPCLGRFVAGRFIPPVSSAPTLGAGRRADGARPAVSRYSVWAPPAPKGEVET